MNGPAAEQKELERDISAKQYVKSHAVSLGLIFVLLAASAFVAWYSMKTQPPREISFVLPKQEPLANRDIVPFGKLDIFLVTRVVVPDDGFRAERKSQAFP